jgi:hypothetical protein
MRLHFIQRPSSHLTLLILDPEKADFYGTQHVFGHFEQAPALSRTGIKLESRSKAWLMRVALPILVEAPESCVAFYQVLSGNLLDLLKLSGG